MTKEQEENLFKQASDQGLTVSAFLLDRVKKTEDRLLEQGLKVDRFVLDCEGDCVSLYFFKEPEGYACVSCYEDTWVILLPDVDCYECSIESDTFLDRCADIRRFLGVE
jgi:hypothetical protein